MIWLPGVVGWWDHIVIKDVPMQSFNLAGKEKKTFVSALRGYAATSGWRNRCAVRRDFFISLQRPVAVFFIGQAFRAILQSCCGIRARHLCYLRHLGCFVKRTRGALAVASSDLAQHWSSRIWYTLSVSLTEVFIYNYGGGVLGAVLTGNRCCWVRQYRVGIGAGTNMQQWLM
jgi:hypothetical protein